MKWGDLMISITQISTSFSKGHLFMVMGTLFLLSWKVEVVARENITQGPGMATLYTQWLLSLLIPVTFITINHAKLAKLCLGYYRPKTKFGARYYFHRRQSVHRGEGVFLTETALDRDPPGQRPPRQRHPLAWLNAEMQWRIQDFPEVRAPTSRGRQHTILPNFPQKTAWNWKNLDPGRGHVPRTPPPRSVDERVFCAVFLSLSSTKFLEIQEQKLTTHRLHLPVCCRLSPGLPRSSLPPRLCLVSPSHGSAFKLFCKYNCPSKLAPFVPSVFVVQNRTLECWKSLASPTQFGICSVPN